MRLIGKENLHGLLRLSVEQAIRFGGAGEGQAMGDAALRTDAVHQLPGHVEPPALRPAAEPARGQPADLRADELHVGAVEVAAQIEFDPLAAVP